jgi:DNA (cytosine-5)-methyltransferase 1
LADGLVVDLFAGGGGASTGIEAALGRPVDIAINHDRLALAVHESNHPATAHLTEDIWAARPADVVRGRPVGLLWASPDCTHHSNAKGGKPRRQEIRALADAVIPWAGDAKPDVICIENVPEFTSWGPLDAQGRPIKARRGEDFQRWLGELWTLGYDFEHRVLDASHYGAPTRRRRFFLVARRDQLPICWPTPTHGPGLLPFHTAAECIDWSLPCPSIFERDRPLAEKTLWRIAQGLKRFVFENPRPFILKVNHGKWEPRHEDIGAPLSTVTAAQRGHALVIPTLQQSGYGERPGQKARVPGLHQPLGTLVNGQKHALVAAFLAKHFGDPQRADGGGGVVVGSELGDPLGTVTAKDHHSLAAVALAQFRGTSSDHPGCSDPRAPMPTISAGGERGGVHVAEVRAFLTAYYGSDGTSGQLLTEPLRTITAKHRLGLVTVAGVDYQIVDIGFRMLQPHELLRAQFGRFADGYDLSRARTKKAQIKLIGNSVCPEVAEALIAANLPRDLARAA